MNAEQSAESLTAGWKGAPGQKPAALDAARKALASTIALGINPAPPAAGPATTTVPVAAAPAFATGQIGADAALANSMVMGLIQNAASLHPSNPSGLPAWARGMQVLESHGPFLDPSGMPHTVLVVPQVTATTVAFDGVTTILGVFPVQPVIGVPGEQLLLGSGSVWIAAQTLVPALSSDSFCGFRITGGTLQATAPFVALGGGYVVPPGITITLTATLAPPSAPAGSSGPGQDAASDMVTMPASVTILFTVTGTTVTALDSSSATVYGTAFTLTRGADPVIAFDNNTNLLVPCTASIADFTFASVASTEFVPSGAAPVVGSGWVLPIAHTTPAALGEAAGAGSLLMGLGGGAAAHWRLHPLDVPVAGWQIFVDPTRIVVIAGGTGGNAVTTRYTLWPEAPPSPRNSTVIFTTPAAFLITFTSAPGTETLIGTGSATAHLDRPIAADGMRYALDEPAVIGITISGSGASVTIFASGSAAASVYERVTPLALENALIGVTTPYGFLLTGLVNGTAFTQCGVAVYFSAQWLLPTLPDPYASTFGIDKISGQTPGVLSAVITWDGTTTGLTFTLSPAANAQSSGPPLSLLPPANNNLTVVSTRTLGGFTALLDLSTKADLFGVALVSSRLILDMIGNPQPPGEQSPPGAPPVAVTPAPAFGVTGLSLAFNGGTVATFALPQVSWEPMESTGPAPPLGALACNPPSDGPPLLLSAPDQQQLVPLAPTPVLLNQIDNVAAGQPFGAVFSLPFGLIANIQQPNSAPAATGGQSLFQGAGGSFALNAPSFAGSLAAALQLTLKPPGSASNPSAQFGGTTSIDDTGGATAGQGYGFQVMGAQTASPNPSVSKIFSGEFDSGGTNPGVPLRRIDLSGYGASIFSEWSDDIRPDPKVTKVHFETVGGRTAFEVIQVETVMYHYAVIMVRTIIMERQAAGWVQRTDSGWVAASDGLFKLPNPDFAGRVHRGAVGGVFNVRNVREIATSISVPEGGTTFVFNKVLFDADIGLDQRVDVLQGGIAGSARDADGNPVTLVPAHDLVGYIQVAPDMQSPDPTVLQGLFAQTGAITANFSCVAQIGSFGAAAGTALRCAAIEGNMASTTTASYAVPALGVALRAAPLLPHDGAWSFGQRKPADPAPTALANDFPVPIVQATGGPNTWYVADIADMLGLDAAATIYGILQDTGTQKLLFERPQIPNLGAGSPAGSTPGIQLPAPPNFADVASLLNATGLFPDIGSSIALLGGPPDVLQNAGNALKYGKTVTFDPLKPATTLLDLGVLQVALAYSDVSRGRDGTGAANLPTQLTYTLDPAAAKRWSFEVKNLSFLVFVPEFSTSDALLTVIGDMVADDQTKPTLANLNLVYGAALDTLKAVFSKLQALAQFLPGGAGAGLNVALADGKLTVTDVFNLPTLPLGLGELSDVGIDIGFTLTLSPLSADFLIGIGGPDNPFHWIVSPLAGTGLIDIGVKDGKPELTVQAGIGLGLAIDVAIASGSASITIAVQLDVTGSTITVMFILNGQASVDVLDGLASASVTLTAAVGVSVDPLPIPQFIPPFPALPPVGVDFPAEDITFLASVSVGIHISICWVVNVDFDGSWQFSQSIHTPEIRVVA